MNLSWRRLGGHHLGLGLSRAHSPVEKAGEEVLLERQEKHMAEQDTAHTPLGAWGMACLGCPAWWGSTLPLSMAGG